MKKLLFFSILIVSVFLIPAARAEIVLVNGSLDNYGQIQGSTIDGGASYIKINYPHSFDEIKIRVSNINTTSTFTGELYYGNQDGTATGYSTAPVEIQYSYENGIDYAIFKYTFRDNSQVGKMYTFYPWNGTANMAGMKIGGVYSDVNADIQLVNTTSAGGDLIDPFIVVSDSTSPDSISITYPQNGTSTSAYFNNWVLHLEYATTTWATSTRYYSTVIYVSDTAADLYSSSTTSLNATANKAGSMLLDCDYELGTPCVSGVTDVYIPSYMNLLPNRQYYAKAFLYFNSSSTSDLVAESYIVNFTTGAISLQETMYDPLYGFTATTSDITGECTWSPNTWFNCAGNVIQTAILFIFTPHDLSLNSLKTQVTAFQDVFPFSLFFGFNEAAQDMLDSYSQSDASLYFPVKFPDRNIVNIPVFTSSTLSSIIGSSAKDVWFDLNKYMAWAFFAWLSVKMIAKKQRV